MKRLFVILMAAVCLPWSATAQRKELALEDRIYETQIRTVQLHPDKGGIDDNLAPSAAPVDAANLVLEFDDLQANRTNYYARLIHCTYDWQKSSLMDLDFLHEYNEFPINDYAFSAGTHLPYVHYRFAIPTVRVPGNYVVVVYRDGDKSDLMLSHRLLLYRNMVNITQSSQLSGTAAVGRTVQPLNFTLDYSSMDIMNALESVHVVIRQNQRWDNAKWDLKPNFLRDADRQIDYRFFDDADVFEGGNEFRWVDFRSLISPGQNTGSLDRSIKPFHLYVQPDAPRTDQAYAQYNDNDGKYIVENLDYDEPKVSSNYLQVTFTLTRAGSITDPIYVVGAFNDWNRNDENRMVFVPSRSSYEATLVLKQGLYNYQYLVESKKLPPWYFEGSHFETENTYEVLVYNHAFQPNADLMIGYFVIPVNPR